MSSRSSISLLDLATPRDRKRFAKLTTGREAHDREAQRSVEKILDDVRRRGDAAVFDYAKRFDSVALNARNIRFDQATFPALAQEVPARLKRAIRASASRIKAYHRHQGLPRFSLRTAEGRLGQITRPLDRVGVYVPGGYTVYPSSLLMNVIPAKLAGVKEIVAVTPGKGGLDPKLAYAFDYLGITEVYRMGGAHAVGALAYGTRSIRPVEKVVGPGNLYVALAKKAVYGTVDIDMVAGPSEVAVLADTTADPRHVALDMLAQAEHGTGDEMAVCITESRRVAQRVQSCLVEEIEKSEVKDVFGRLRPGGLCICITRSRSESLELVNRIAPEHLQIITKSPRKDLSGVRNAAAVFLGKHTPVALGDYFVGTNHVLPTGGASRFASALGVDDFLKRISVAEVSARGLKSAAQHVSAFARAEGFMHHALSVERRLKK